MYTSFGLEEMINNMRMKCADYGTSIVLTTQCTCLLFLRLIEDVTT